MTRRLRLLLAALAGPLVAVLVLAACDTNVGTAARVGDQRVSETDVSRYLTPLSTPFNGQNGVVEPKAIILTYLIQQDLAPQLLAATPGGMPSQGEITQAEDQLLTAGSDTRESLRALYTSKQFTAPAADLAIRATALMAILQNRIGSNPQFFAQHNVPVSVDPRYGTWDPQSFSVSTAGPNLPFLTIQSSYTPLATPSPQ